MIQQAIDKRIVMQTKTDEFWSAERKLLDNAFADIRAKQQAAERWFAEELSKLKKVRK